MFYSAALFQIYFNISTYVKDIVYNVLEKRLKEGKEGGRKEERGKGRKEKGK